MTHLEITLGLVFEAVLIIIGIWAINKGCKKLALDGKGADVLETRGKDLETTK